MYSSNDIDLDNEASHNHNNKLDHFIVIRTLVDSKESIDGVLIILLYCFFKILSNSRSFLKAQVQDLESFLNT